MSLLGLKKKSVAVLAIFPITVMAQWRLILSTVDIFRYYKHRNNDRYNFTMLYSIGVP
jgi:hypothetical protein